MSMKKLMIAACGVLVVTLSTRAEEPKNGIMSAEIVGYATGALRKEFSAMGAQFVPVDGKAIDMTEIIPTGYDKDMYEGGSIYVQWLDANGRGVFGKQYFWYDDEDGTGWFDGSDNPLEKGKTVLEAGEGLWVRANSTAEGLRIAGVVPAASTDIYLRKGYKLVVNPAPESVNWNDDDSNGKFIVAGGYDRDTYEGGTIYVQYLDAYGRGVEGAQFFWYDDEDGTGWFDGQDEFVTGKKLDAGVGIWVRANSTNEKITFPAALQK